MYGMLNRIGIGALGLALALALCATAAAQRGGHGHPGGEGGAGGRVTAVDVAARTLTVARRDGSALTIVATDATAFVRNGEPATLADFGVGDFVRARGALDAEGRLVAERISGGDDADRTGGEITAISADLITIAR